MLDAAPAVDAPLEAMRDAYIRCVHRAAFYDFIDLKFDGNLILMAERALLACQTEENALVSASLLSPLLNPAYVRAVIDALKVRLKNELIEETAPKKR